MTRDELLHYLNRLLKPELFHDYAPNGLQVEGKEKIERIITGVTANQALFDEAVKQEADLVFVHHGFFWQDEDPRVIGIKKNRLQTLLNHNINLIGYHLPLDAHPIYGNNAQLAKLFDFVVEDRMPSMTSSSLVWKGKLSKAVDGKMFCQQLKNKLHREPLYIPGRSEKISSIAWCSGGAGSYIGEIVDCNFDAYLTGEVTESIVHVAREYGMHLFVAGHHATERYGVKALGEHIAEKFNVQCQFVDVDSPV
ncbi:MAG: Nif3-like dinuclear metal center hexameric protein [Gammaproteobacteria bacterium RIFCSPHIGHO2_02_FULL_42_13]|nr:MAG: Nif3-like dinuclear metal center hexameric protein [Gammaproteobacteria bacterium RIFCSPHIGHO2_02_FULL_42_13]OGT68110.1 MAG: Nif3-like dinuclear metal center hexameric protein [Gammaproteobacteria bacterium RIFCSPLOWO2_02_FULL_42_9]